MIFGKNILDLIILAILLGCMIYSLFRGLVHEFFALLAMILGLFLARYHYLALAGKWLVPRVSLGLGKIIAFILLFLAGYLTTILFGKIVRKIIASIELAWLDHLGGAMFGLLKGGLLISVLVAALVIIFPQENFLIRTSQFVPHIIYILQRSESFVSLLPPEIHRVLEGRAAALKRFWRGHPAKPLKKKSPQRQKQRQRKTTFLKEVWLPAQFG